MPNLSPHLNMTEHDDRVILRPLGILDETTACRTGTALQELAGEYRDRRLILDLSGIQCFEYLGVAALCGIIRSYWKCWQSIELVGLHEAVLKVFSGT